MIYLRFFYLVFFLLASPLMSNEIQIIELHQNKSLDQLVLESNNITSDDNQDAIALNDDSISQSDAAEMTDQDSTLNDDKDQNNLDKENNEVAENEISETSEVVTLIETEQLFDMQDKIINHYMENIINIRSKTLNKEFVNIISKPNLEDEEKINSNIYFIVKKLYEIGEIGKAYNLIKSIDTSIISNEKHLAFFQLIELNYLLSTFKLSDVCDLKTDFIEKGAVLPKNLLEKTDIFCLTLENKFAEAKLLNSLLLETKEDVDENFQKLFNYMILKDQENLAFKSQSSIKSKELIFLYSAMLRINELPLDEDFINIDPLNLSIPVILSNSTDMQTRIKAANKAYYDDMISIDSLSALYQSVDFNSKEFNKPDQTILELNQKNELIMAFYFQLANIQIFPEDRLNVIIDYWEFAKNIGLEKIAYAITRNIIETFTPTSENSKFAMEIALAHIANKNFNEADKWIKISENSNIDNDKIDYAKFLIELNKSDSLETIVNFLSDNNNDVKSLENQNFMETMEVLNSFLNIDIIPNSTLSYDKITDDRLMPSFFLIRDIKENMKSENDLTLFFLSLLSMDNKSWVELHPEHLYLLLNTYNLYDQGSLTKSIILEILNDLQIMQ